MTRWMLALVLSLVSNLAFAQAAPANFYLPLPAKGLWLTLNEPGAGYAVDHRPDGFMFIAVYTYDQARQPIFYTMQGQLEVLSAAERASSGVYARLRADLNRAVGGTCFGCPFQSPVITPLPGGAAEFRFFTATRGEFRFGSYVTQLDAPAIGPDVGKGIEGDWVMLWKLGNTLVPVRFVRIRAALPANPPPHPDMNPLGIESPRANRYSMSCLYGPIADEDHCDVPRSSALQNVLISQDQRGAIAHFVISEADRRYIDTYHVLVEPDRMLMKRNGYWTRESNVLPDEVEFRRMPPNALRTDGTPYVHRFPPNPVFPWP